MTATNGHAAMVVQGPASAALQTEDASRAFEPSSINEAIQLSKILVASRLMPDGMNSPEAAFTVIMTGRELGLTVMQSIRALHVIKGKVAMSADAMAALCKRRPAICRYFTVTEYTDTRATVETHRVGDERAVRMSFTIEQARAAGLMGNANWKNYPSAMLRARATAALARAVYPDIILGLYDPDELLGTPAPATVEAPARPPAEARSAPLSEPTLQPDLAEKQAQAFAALSKQLDEATTVQQHRAFAKAAKSAREEGLLTEATSKALQAAGKRRYTEIQGAALPPSDRKSEPKAAEEYLPPEPPDSVRLAYDDVDGGMRQPGED